MASGCVFFLLIDDIDQVADPSDPAHLNRIWALLLAVRRLVGECPSLRCIVSLRSEVWTRLVSENRGQRDQTDHIRNLIISLRAPDVLTARILLRRLALAAGDLGRTNVDPYTVFFEGADEPPPVEVDAPHWETTILQRTRERPRDAIQLVAHIANRARGNSHSTMRDSDFDEALGPYSRERVEDVSMEFWQECSTLRQIIETFARTSSELSFEELRAHLRTVGSQFAVTIRDIPVRQQDDEDALRLLSFLHETGFINPLVANAKHQVVQHLTFHDAPYFVAKDN